MDMLQIYTFRCYINFSCTFVLCFSPNLGEMGTVASVFSLASVDSSSVLLSTKSKRSLGFCHFLGSVWYNYLNHPNHRCEYITENDSFLENVLQYVFVLGGAVRDYLLNSDINDIDIDVNNYELDKLFYNHLIKYHYKKHCKNSASDSEVKCCLWNLYLNKRKLNAAYFVDILKNCKLLQGKYKYKAIQIRDGVAIETLEITEDLMYLDEIDLRGEIIEMADTFTGNPNINKLKHTRKPIPWYKRINLVIRKDNASDDSSDYIDINFDLHTLDIASKQMTIDLSINCVIIFFSDIYNPNNSNKTNYNWCNSKIIKTFSQIDNSIFNNGLFDLRNKIINTPIKDNIYVFRQQYDESEGYMHFWRLIKIMVKFSNKWTVDTQLINDTIKFYSVWMNYDMFSNERKYSVFCKWFLDYYIKDKIKEYPLRFEAMEILEFHNYLIPLFKQFSHFREYLIDKIKSKSEKEKQLLISLLKKYKYL